ncbi:hypothetical protein JYQ62_32695 [Nostoc sp. UHCC 0702]|nr:hypothetical protein JYQ62_32695 [Nostoc sp. UHCC 0702]
MDGAEWLMRVHTSVAIALYQLNTLTTKQTLIELGSVDGWLKSLPRHPLSIQNLKSKTV